MNAMDPRQWELLQRMLAAEPNIRDVWADQLRMKIQGN